MTAITPALIDRMVQAIVDEVDPEQVILFGSRGRGDHRHDSDVDLIVVEAEPFGPERSRHREMERLYHALAGVPSRPMSSSTPTRTSTTGAILSTTSSRGHSGKGRCSMTDPKLPSSEYRALVLNADITARRTDREN